jgi:hypothetical protein
LFGDGRKKEEDEVKEMALGGGGRCFAVPAGLGMKCEPGLGFTGVCRHFVPTIKRRLTIGLPWAVEIASVQLGLRVRQARRGLRGPGPG